MIRTPHSRIAALCCVGALLCASVGARAEPPIEYQIQAAYVSKFLRFVEWPPHASGSEVFTVGVVGGRDFQQAMQALDGHQVGEASVSVLPLDGQEALARIDVLVIEPERSTQETRALLKAVAERPILTVGQKGEFNDLGGIIRFLIEDDSLRFEINNAAAKRAGLKLSSRLLRLARNVR